MPRFKVFEAGSTARFLSKPKVIGHIDGSVYSTDATNPSIVFGNPHEYRVKVPIQPEGILP
jgi:hypothetical protein